MSKATLNYVVHRLVTESDFRDKFEKNKEKILGDLDLDYDERKALSEMDVEELIASADRFRVASARAAVGSLYI